MNWIWVALGGAVGSCFRYGVDIGFSNGTSDATLPWSTFTVNVLGSFVLAAVVFFVGVHTAALRTGPLLFVTTGFAGGFTTYSAFNLQVVKMIHAGQWPHAVLYSGVMWVACVGAAAAAWWCCGRAITP